LPPKRRAIYFAFQGLFTAVLLLLSLYQRHDLDGRMGEFTGLTVLLLGSLLLIRLISESKLARAWFSTGLFIGDAVAASVVLRWINPRPELFLLYFLVVFGSALTRNFRQSLVISSVTIVIYALSRAQSGDSLALHGNFWLRLMFLAVSAALLAILSLDTQAAQDEDKRRYDERLIQVERLAMLGRVAAEVAHRIKGPLTTIAVNAEVAAHRHGDNGKTLKDMTQIGEEVGRCKEILKDLLDLGRIEEMDAEVFDLRIPIERALKLIKPQAAERRLKADLSGLAGPMMVRGDESLMQEALGALLQNAVEAASRGGRVQLECATFAGRHRLSVSDDGAGVPRADIEKIFQPFFTTKQDGSGLGLSAALRIAQKHGGTVEAESAGEGLGARFTLVIPAAK